MPVKDTQLCCSFEDCYLGAKWGFSRELSYIVKETTELHTIEATYQQQQEVFGVSISPQE